MTPAQAHLFEAMCERAAECWSDGYPDLAEAWFDAAVMLRGCGQPPSAFSERADRPDRDP